MSIILAFLIALASAFFPPCATEDSTFCTWDAATQGNGTGANVLNLSEGVYIRF